MAPAPRAFFDTTLKRTSWPPFVVRLRSSDDGEIWHWCRRVLDQEVVGIVAAPPEGTWDPRRYSQGRGG
eukprot:8754115-Pyramimonas_sp.AAC.1